MQHTSLSSQSAAGNISFVEATQQMILQFPDAIANSRVLELQFTYPLSDGLSGFYRSEFPGELSSLEATLQCAPTRHRRQACASRDLAPSQSLCAADQCCCALLSAHTGTE